MPARAAAPAVLKSERVLLKREDHIEEEEKKARRSLDHLSRRWPLNPNIFYALLLIVLLFILFLSL